MRRAPSVLVVDDVSEVRRTHTQFFHGSEMEVFSAENGAQALDAVRRVMPDVVVTDVDMPVMDGLDLYRQLRSDAASRSRALSSSRRFVCCSSDAERSPKAVAFWTPLLKALPVQ